MSEASLKSMMAIILSLILAMSLTILPMPNGANLLRPLWIMMILIYWVLALPHRVNVGIAWCCGLVSDVLYGSVLGEHAFVYTLIAYFVYKMHIRMRLASGLQKSLTVFGLLVLHQLLLLILQGLQGQATIHGSFWLPCVSSTVIWSWLFLVLRDYRRRFQVK